MIVSRFFVIHGTEPRMPTRRKAATKTPATADTALRPVRAEPDRSGDADDCEADPGVVMTVLSTRGSLYPVIRSPIGSGWVLGENSSQRGCPRSRRSRAADCWQGELV